MQSVALANQKGGVGKTTTAVHLAHGLALSGARVALVDLDPQGNATLAVQDMRVEEDDAKSGSGDGVWAALEPLRDDLWLLPSPGATRDVRHVKPDVAKLVALRDALAKDGCDWLLVDCPPRMDAWGWAGLEMTERVLLPVQPEFFSMHGLGQMMQTLRQAERQIAGQHGLLGVLVTMFPHGEEVAHEVVADLEENLGERLLGTIIHRDPEFVEAASHGTTLFDYNPRARGAFCYGELTREVLYGRA